MNRSLLSEQETWPGTNGHGSAAARVLVVEDDAVDAELILDQLRSDGLAVDAQVVLDADGYRRALDDFGPDIVLSDLSLPGFSGTQALAMLRARDPSTPFVFVSGTIGESAAIEALRGGATDYILKSNMARLASAVRRAIAEAAERQARAVAESELVRTQRFETLAILAGSLGHDLRNTLQPVLMAADLIETKAADPEITRLCAMVRECSNQGLTLVAAMLDLARGGQGAADKRIRLHALLDAICMLLKPSLPKNIELVIGEVDPALEIPGSANELQQCLLNLALNASQAMPDGGRLDIAAEPFHAEEPFFRDNEPRSGSTYVRISVVDTGHGMDEDTLARLFTPFFTTKESGNGLGLVSCRRFVENHRGVIRVNSQTGQGSRFDLYLPVEVEHGTAADSPRDEAGDVVGHGERILVLCPDRAVRQGVAEILELYGYDPVLASATDQALAELEGNEAPQVVIIDRDLLAAVAGNAAASLRAAGYEGPMIVIGAASRGSAAANNGHAAVHLSKPVTAPSLLQALRTALPTPGRRR